MIVKMSTIFFLCRFLPKSTDTKRQFFIYWKEGGTSLFQSNSRRNKMATFFNQATLSYGDNVTNSNVTTGEIVSGIGLTKTAASTNYGADDGISYVVTLVNSTATDRTGVSITDNLGVYNVGSTSVVPLTYVDGSVLYYQNGVLKPAPTVTAGTDLVISGITVPAGGNVTLVYEATANNFAPLAAGSVITNTVTSGEESDTATVPVREEAALTIAKAICPAVVSDNGELTYTFVIQNSGNLAADAADNVTVTDVFNPALTNITVTLDGAALTEGTGYTYNPATGAFSTVPGVITVPAATYTQDTATGVITTTPGVAILTVSGTI